MLPTNRQANKTETYVVGNSYSPEFIARDPADMFKPQLDLTQGAWSV